MFDIERFIRRNYSEDEIGEYGNPVTDLQINCPFCDHDYKQHLHISLVKNAIHCFKCGYGGSWVNFVMTILGCSYAEAIQELYVVPKIREDISEVVYEQLTKKPIEQSSSHKLKLPVDFQLLKESNSAPAKQVMRYLNNRGFAKEDWEFYNFGICTATHPFRVIIPVEDGYYQARAITSWMQPKYLNPKTEARHFIFNSAALELYDEVVICEGVFNAMTVGKNAIAIIGKELPLEKLQRLVDSKVKGFIVALDYDAEKHAVKIADSLYRAGKSVRFWKFKTEADLADGGLFEEFDYDISARLKMLL